MPYFIICIPGCIDLEGQFWGGRKEAREANSGDRSPCVEGSLGTTAGVTFADQSWEMCLHTLKTFSRFP